MDHNKELTSRLDQVYFHIIDLKHGKIRLELKQMWKHVRNTFDLMDRELVNCRRQHKITGKYLELERNCIESLEIIEQHLTFATLLT